MFDVGLLELAVIALVAVVVLGLASLAPLRAQTPSYDDAPVEPRDEPSEV